MRGYDGWLRINEDRHFTAGIYCGTGVLYTDGEFHVGGNGNRFKVDNSSLTSNVTSTFNAQTTFNGGLIANSANISQEICNTLIVKDELRSAKWNIDNITNLGSTFYVSPCIVFTNPSVYVNSISGTTVTLTITDNSITSSTIGGATWTNESKIKLMGRIGNSVLGTVNGWLKRDLNSTTAKTAYILLNFSDPDLVKLSEGATYSGSDVGDLKMMLYEVNKIVNGTAKNRPIGILLSSYGENKKPCIDIYNGDIEDGSPVARMGYLNGLPSVNGVSPTGYGFYAAGNAYFSGTLVSSSGKIGGFSLSENSIQNGSLGQSGGVLICTGTNSSASIGGSDSINGWCFTASNTFGVTKTGELYATSGKIGGCSITNGVLSITNATSIYASFEGNGKTNSYFHVATLKIVSSYINCATVIGARSRGYGYSEVNIQFGSQKETNPNLDFFNQTGRGDWYIKKTATSTWDVYCRKYENWAWAEVVKYLDNSGVEITWGTGNADLPSDSIRATQLAGSSAWCYNNDSTYIDGGNIYAGTVTADKITANNISGTNGWINLRSGLFDYGNGKLKWDGTSLSITGNGKFAGEITATSGKIGKYTIDNYLITGSGSTCTGMGGDKAFWAGSDDSSKAPFRVGYNGKLWASNATISGIINSTDGSIGGWKISSDKLLAFKNGTYYDSNYKETYDAEYSITLLSGKNEIPTITTSCEYYPDDEDWKYETIISPTEIKCEESYIAPDSNGVAICNSTVYSSNGITFYNGVKIDGLTKVLWEGADYMSGDQTAWLDEKVSNQFNGIVLVWSGYSNGKANNGDVHTQFIPKWCVTEMNGGGHAFIDPYRRIDKYFYVYNDKIVGNNINGTSGTEGGITYNNSNCVLRAVIGV